MNSSDRLAILLPLIYEGCLDLSVWPRFLDELGAALDCVGAVLFVHDTVSARTRMSLTARLDPSAERAYNDYYFKKDVWVLRARELLRSRDCYTSEMACSGAELARTEFYNDYLRPLGVFHGICGQVMMTGGSTCALASSRTARAGAFGEEEVTFFRTLLPHVSRALAVQTRLASLDAENRAMVETLDRLSAGCILLDASGRVSMVNHAARLILDAKDGIALEGESVTLGTASDRRDLTKLIAGALGIASGAHLLPGCSMLVHRPSLRRPYSLMVSPLGRNASSILQSPATLMVVITDPETPGQLESLCLMYRLTKKEALLASVLFGGSNLSQAADQLGVTINTAKTHLSRIFSKTGVRRQSELVRLFSTAATAMVAKHSSPNPEN